MDLVSSKKPDFIFLMETKVGRAHAERLRVKLGFDGLLYVDSVGLSGGLALFWRSNNTSAADEGSHGSCYVHYEIGPHSRGLSQEILMTCFFIMKNVGGFLTLRIYYEASVILWKTVACTLYPWRDIHSLGSVVEALMPGWRNGLIESLRMRLGGPQYQRPEWERRVFSHRGRRSFKFEMAWLLDEGCRGVVEEAWHEGRSQDNDSLAKFNQLDGELSRLEAQEDVFWRQRAKQHWLRGADANTKFYHRFASARKRKNTITKLQDDSGVWHEGEGFHPLILSYYENIFESSGVQDMTTFPSFPPRVSIAQNEALLLPFTAEEVKAALYSMFLDKAPGPDGMNPGFYQHFWDVVGTDVTDFVLHCLHSGSFPDSLNDANIVLIPKKNPPETVSDLRPIALCNVIYKIMAKMLANRMKSLMSVVISESQSAFIPGRLITDNILVAAEVGHYLNRKQLGQVGWAALKLDMAKAYDRMEWVFLRKMIEVLGFDAKWIDLIMLYVTTVRYNILINGACGGTIIPTRGLRQGNPLSPYLFIICAEGLSQLIQHAQNAGSVQGCRVARGAPAISHLFFVDDSLLFFKANSSEAAVVKECLHRYEILSGQAVNFHKSSVCFSRNTDVNDRLVVTNTLGVVQASDFGKYLGLPSFIGRNKRRVFAYIEDKIRQRVGSWNKKILSRAGKEILLKSVAQSMPTFSMSVFLLPDSLCVALERMMNKFWWGSGGGNERGIHWLSWKRMCTPKCFGGLGFKELRAFNLALLGKQGWRFLTNPASLVAGVYKARYFSNSTFVDAVIGPNPNACWRGIYAAKDLICGGIRRRIGDGASTRIWDSPWLPDSDPCIQTLQPQYLSTATVSGLINPNTNEWDEEILMDIFEPRDVELIKRVPISPGYVDSWYWLDDLRGIYSVKSGYKRIRGVVSPLTDDFTSWNKVWNLKIPPRWKTFLWRAITNTLPTTNNLIQRRLDINPFCPLCAIQAESVSHVFICCAFAVNVWRTSHIDISDGAGLSFSMWFEQLLNTLDAEEIIKVAAILYAIWSARNSALWEAKVPTPASVVALARRALALPPSFLRCHVDAAYGSCSGKATAGVVLLRPNGEFVAAMSTPLPYCDSVIMAETLACKEALSWLKGRNEEAVVLLTDCAVLCANLRSSLEIMSYIGIATKECCRLMSTIVSCSVLYIPRSNNVLAHVLARDCFTSLQGDTLFWDIVPPSSIMEFLI
ncbi:uncharacterized protein LOC116027784 [Ipomoea triloba]|uniref:uncharacterized protein LOC116027784 n=1 Tax=Ipomoea triloba TaxID=35885 RepID=UPI00125E0C66|nr:uncharacterized protein LOC116027784 [Ipomoea triloba]